MRRKRSRIQTGPKKPPIVSKIRRTQKQAYGDRWDWLKLVKEIKDRDGNKCRKCGSTKNLQVDHILSVARGGRTVKSNLWTLCDFCHSKRPGHRQARHLILHKRNSK